MRIRALIVVATVAFVSHASAAAQDVFATTDDGDVVVLSLDGTWRGATDLEIDAVYGPPPPAAPVGLDRAYSFDTGTGWREGPPNGRPEGEVYIQLGNQPVFASVTYEDVQYPVAFVRDMALANSRANGFTIEVASETPVDLDGADALLVEVIGTPTEGVAMPFRFQILFASGPQGTIQLWTWTFDALFESHRQSMEDLREGMHLLPPPSADGTTRS